ncbi:MAG: hypothetical protein GX237_03350 [Clostridiales bacterium]|nr:hypothetical protein [Clostridiales bacterium]
MKMESMLKNKEEYGEKNNKNKEKNIIVFSIMVFFIIIIILIINITKPLEKIRWAKEQKEIDDFVIYSQRDQYFGWRMSGVVYDYKAKLKIYPVYRKLGDLRMITDETYKYKEKEISLKQELKEPPKEEIQEFTNSRNVIRQEYNIPNEGFFRIIESTSNENITFYLWKEKYLITGGIKEEFSHLALKRVDICDIETGELYDYKYASMANKPENVSVPDNIINAKYYIDAEGRIICIYKYYNKLYCARLN